MFTIEALASAHPSDNNIVRMLRSDLSAMIKFSAAILISSFMGIASPASAVIVGTNTGQNNCYPYGCLAASGGIRYQEVFSSAAFPSPTSFNTISSFLAPGFGNVTDNATISIAFSITSRQPSTLSNNLSSNVTGPETNFGTFTVPQSTPATLSFSGATINYDPSLGSLLEDVTVISHSSNSFQTAYQSDGTSGMVGRAYAYTGSSGSDQTGLITQFSMIGTTAVPEPVSLILLGAGVAVAFVGRRRN